MDIIKRYETLQIIFKSMSRNIKFIMLTVVFAVILIYIYSVFGYLFYSSKSTSPTGTRL